VRVGIVALVLLATAACGSNDAKQSVNRDTLTQRQKDSILANSRIPNAGAVGRAMKAADSASMRALRSDSVARDTTEQ
jgi:hypothetical protein